MNLGPCPPRGAAHPPGQGNGHGRAVSPRTVEHDSIAPRQALHRQRKATQLILANKGHYPPT